MSRMPFYRTKKLKLAVGAVLVQLILVIIGAAEIELPGNSWLVRALNYYGDASGASAGYGFFAPEVTSQIRATFDIVDKNKRHIRQEWKDETNREVDLRLGDIVEQFLNGDEDEAQNLQHDLAASLSGSVFARHPDAQSVTMKLEQFVPVSMQDFRNGHRAKWTFLYSTTFEHKHIVMSQ